MVQKDPNPGIWVTFEVAQKSWKLPKKSTSAFGAFECLEGCLTQAEGHFGQNGQISDMSGNWPWKFDWKFDLKTKSFFALKWSKMT